MEYHVFLFFGFFSEPFFFFTVRKASLSLLYGCTYDMTNVQKGVVKRRAEEKGGKPSIKVSATLSVSFSYDCRGIPKTLMIFSVDIRRSLT